MRIIRLCIIALATTILTACTSPTEQRAEDFDRLLTAYQETGSAEDLEALLEEWPEPRDMHFGFEDLLHIAWAPSDAELQKRWAPLRQEAEQMLIREERWDVLASVHDVFHITPSSAAMLASVYPGDDPDLLKAIGHHFREVGKLEAAYNAYARAASDSYRAAELVRGLTYHYGCGDLYRIWGELTDGRAYMDGEALTLSDPQLSHREMVQARIALRNGQIPDIPESCPLDADYSVASE